MDSNGSTGYLTVAELASELGMDRSHMRRYLLRHHVDLIRVRPPGLRGQQCLALTPDAAERVRELRQGQGFVVDEAARLPMVPSMAGVFYIIQLVPDLQPLRLKVGFATDVQDRLNSHRTAAPTAVLLWTWPCRRQWELTAIDAITREGCTQIGAEVYDVGSLEDVRERADAFFTLMPSA